MIFKTKVDNLTLYNASYRAIGILKQNTKVDVISRLTLGDKEWATLNDDTMVISKYKGVETLEKVRGKKEKS